MSSGPGETTDDVLIRTDGHHTHNVGAFGDIGPSALAGDDTFYFLRGSSEAGYSLIRLRPQDAAPQEVWFSGPGADGFLRLYAAATQVYLIVETLEDVNPEASPTLTLYVGDSTGANLRRMGRLPSNSSLMTPHGEDLYFATDRLWRSNGTLTGTVPLSITTGITLPFVGLAASGDLLYFLQGPTLLGEIPMTQLWQTDGTQAGTRQVLAIPRHPQWNYLRAEGKHVTFMVALDTGPQYWWSDGTPAGSGATTLGAVHFSDDRGFILAGTEQDVQGLWTVDSTTPRLLRSFTRSPQLTPRPFWLPQGVGWRGAYYFTAADVAHGLELWRSDGTETGTVLVKDVNTTPDPMGDPTRYGPPQFLTPGETLLYFLADDAISGRQIWRSDGTSDSTFPLGAPPLSAWVSDIQIVTVQDHAYFTWSGLNAIWRSDGTTAGTYALPDSGFWQARLANVNGHLLMTGIRQHPDSGDWTGGFWRSNVAGDGLELVRDLADTYRGGTYDLYGTPPSIGNLAWFSFNVDPVVTGRIETWRSDGTPEGTALLEMPLSLDLFTPGRGMAYAQFYLDDADRVQLWRSDGTPGGTVLLHEFVDDDWRNERGPLWPSVVVGSRYYAVARQIGQPQVLWVSDGTPAGTRPVRPLATMTPESARLNVALAVDGEMLYALEQDGGHLRLWRSDGTLERTHQIAVYSVPDQPLEPSLWVVNGTAVFLAPLVGGGSELFCSSNEPRQTVLLGNIRPGPESSNATGFVRVGNLLYFIADDGSHGAEPWAADLTSPFVIHHTYLPALRH